MRRQAARCPVLPLFWSGAASPVSFLMQMPSRWKQQGTTRARSRLRGSPWPSVSFVVSPCGQCHKQKPHAWPAHPPPDAPNGSPPQTRTGHVVAVRGTRQQPPNPQQPTGAFRHHPVATNSARPPPGPVRLPCISEYVNGAYPERYPPNPAPVRNETPGFSRGFATKIELRQPQPISEVRLFSG